MLKKMVQMGRGTSGSKDRFNRLQRNLRQTRSYVVSPNDVRLVLQGLGLPQIEEMKEEEEEGDEESIATNESVTVETILSTECR